MKALWAYTNQKTFKVMETSKISISGISKPLFCSLFSQSFWKFLFSKSCGEKGGGGEVVKHAGPLGIYKPKTFSYRDFNFARLFPCFVPRARVFPLARLSLSFHPSFSHPGPFTSDSNPTFRVAPLLCYVTFSTQGPGPGYC
jgi:hypothetical protein